MTRNPGPSAPAGAASIRFSSSPSFARWLYEHRISLAVSTYEAGKLLLMSSADGQRVRVLDRTIPMCMGVGTGPDRTLNVVARGRVLRFRDAGPRQGFDHTYLPRTTWYTGALDAHDLAVDARGPLLAATELDAVLRPSDTRSFELEWQPPWLSGPAMGDRCHLNGLAVHQGRLVAVTMAGRSTTPQGWRAHRSDGGLVLSVPDGRVLASGLSMPHAPRIHQGALWLLESGRGRVVRVVDGQVQPVLQVPGFARGLAFVGEYLVVGLSRPRAHALKGLPLEERLQGQGRSPSCGVLVARASDGEILAGLRIDGEIIHEIYDVAVIRDSLRPNLVGFRQDERFTVIDYS